MRMCQNMLLKWEPETELWFQEKIRLMNQSLEAGSLRGLQVGHPSIILSLVPCAATGLPTGNGKKLSSSQAQLGQATCLAVA